MELIIFAILWYISGFLSCVYWITKKYDFDTTDLFISGYSAVLGPIAFIIGYVLYAENPKVLIKRRTK